MECEYFVVISINSLLVYQNKYYLQVYLDNCPYKIIDQQMVYYKRIDINKVIDLGESNKCK